MEDQRFLLKLLSSVENTLRERIDVSSLDVGSRAYFNQTVSLLSWTIATAEQDGAFVQAHDEALAALARESSALLGTELAAVAEVAQSWTPKTMLQGSAGSPDSLNLSVFAELAAKMDHLGSGEDRAAAHDIFRRFLALEEEAITTVDAAARSTVASTVANFAPGAGEKKQATPAGESVSEETLTAYLRRKFPDQPGIRATGLRSLPGGFSKDTFSFAIEQGGSNDGQVVMRQDLPVEKRTSAIDEFPILELAVARGIPAPAPLWPEPDKAALNGSFIIVKHAPGRNDISSWAKEPEACRRFADEFARSLVAIHAIRPADLGLGPEVGATAAEAQLNHMRWLRDHYRSSVTVANPRIEAAFGWLMANFPKGAEALPPSLVHGGAGFHNLLTENGKLHAILDWEYTHFGDPADDLAYVRQFVEIIMPWPEFMARYNAHGGCHYSDAQDRYYGVWRFLRNACGCAGTRKVFVESEYNTLKLAAGVASGARHELLALRAIAKAIAGDSVAL